MALNIVDATNLLDNELTKDETNFLLAARQGVAVHDADDAILRHLIELDLVQIVPFDHPRATNAIVGVIPTESGTKILNILDSRKWDDPEAPVYDTPATPSEDNSAMKATQDFAKKDEATTKGAIKKDSPKNKDYDNKH